MKKRNLALFFGLSCLTLASCGLQGTVSSSSSVFNYEVKWISPTGSPSLVFYQDGYNRNWISSSNPGDAVQPSLLTNNYDAVVFDGVSGLNTIKKAGTSSKYKLADWITGGSFYVVSTKHTAEEEFPSNAKINSFVETGNASRSFRKLAASWGWDGNNIDYQSGVSDVVKILMLNGDAYDYHVVAQPALETAKEKLGDKLHIVYNLQDEWKKAGYGEIPGGALFVNTERYAVYKAKINAFLTRTRLAKDTLIANPDKAVASFNAYEPGDNHNTKLKERFGIANADVITKLQKDGANQMNFISSEKANNKQIANSFAEALGDETFGDELFL